MLPLTFAVCENFEAEARAALDGVAPSDAALAIFPARCGRPPLGQRELEELVGPCCGEAAEVIGSVCCAALRRAPALPAGWRVHALESCFELLAPKPMVDAQLREGAYVLTSGWLRGWRERFARDGVADAALARQVFGESATRLVLLDTGVDPDARSRLDELSEHLALPAEVVPVGVDLLRERLRRMRAEAAMAAERKAHSTALAAAHALSAEYAAAFDVVGCLADSVNEREVVERALDVCSTLFAPARLAYLSLGSASDALEVRPPLTDAAERRRLADRLVQRMEPKDGFTLAIEHGGQLFGVLGVEEVAFPRSLDRYLDLASTVARVCGMAVANARAFQDVKLAKESLAMERERLAVTLNSIGDGVIATDREGKVLLLNQVCAELTGFEQDEAVGRPLEEVFRVLDERTREPLVDPVAQVLRIGKAVDLINGALLVRRDGVEHHVADSAAPILDRDGRTLGVVLVFRDVTAQKRTSKLQRVLDGATELLASSLDMQRVLGDVARRVTAELHLGCSIDAAAPVELPGSDIQTGPGAARLVVPMSSAAHERPRGTVTFTSSSALDAEHVAFARELARRAALALENAGLLETTRQAVLARDRFLSIASHELRTPLTSLQLQGEAMRRRLARGEDVSFEQVERLTATLLRQVRRVRRLVDDMIDVSRMNTGKLELRREQVDLSAIVAAELENRAEELRAKGYAVTLRTEPGIVGAWDPQRIEQVVANLVGNAIRYGQGAPLEIAVSRDATAARLLVRDRGPGIDPQDQRRIFDAFERATGASEAAEGLGLGLYIVAQIVAAHGGSVAVESAAGAGSTFVVQLPLERRHS